MKRLLAVLAVAVVGFSHAEAQEQASPWPVFTGAFAFFSDSQHGQTDFGPKFEPVILFPIGKRLLVESEYTMELPVAREAGQNGPAVLSHSFEYLQLDYSATDFLTIVGGYFATPFGIYKERLDPIWIRNLLDEPLLFGVNDNSSNGVMLRGAYYVTRGFKLNYAAGTSASVDNSQFVSRKQVNGRVGVLIPRHRLEVGTSFGRTLDQNRYTLHGLDVSWKPMRVALELRGEGLWSRDVVSGYWAEAAYDFPGFSSTFLRHSQAVIRMEQVTPGANVALTNAELPEERTRRVMAGWNRWVTNRLRASAAFGGDWQHGSPSGIVSIGVAFVFVEPMGERP